MVQTHEVAENKKGKREMKKCDVGLVMRTVSDQTSLKFDAPRRGAIQIPEQTN